ncbi:hypothetical protein [Rhizobium sp. BK176]|uniref:hypothetical protein n=1 Tax=Rhizobium sp. BK176 TaxID=2587071 RepID=UPI002167BD0D|nr:hypothetical protein [Rhizobium sp. BK176]MCS4088660.1 hypothetical protein [Rhizobium sp. BK176]
MVDFRKMAQDAYNNATPEERARIDAYHAREAKYDLTRREFQATFTRYAERPLANPPRNGIKTETYATKTWTKAIDVRIEDREHNGRKYEIIRFIGGSTGHEVFELDEDFATGLVDGKWAQPGTLWICAGSVRYDGCSLPTEDVIEYIREMRPHLLGAEPQTPAPPFRAPITF